MTAFNQPVFSRIPEPGHNPSDAFTLDQFLTHLRQEEDYWDGDQNNTRLILTRLRKIFYDQWGWNSELIRGAANVQSRYEVIIRDSAPTDANVQSRELVRYENNQYQPKHRVIVYRKNDRVFGSSRAGETPDIYKNDHQEVLLPSGYYCDMAHILAGLDAYNHPQIVSPLPNFLLFLGKLFPHVDHNEEVVTWMGDIASSCGDFLFHYLRHNKQPLTVEKEQEIVDRDAPGSDMLGNIDAYIIRCSYDVGSENGQRPTDIFDHYYNAVDSPRLKRCSTFCEAVGLKDFNGEKFANEEKWLKHNTSELLHNIEFQVFSLTNEKLSGTILPLKIWLGGYRKVLKARLSLELFLKTLKTNINLEAK